MERLKHIVQINIVLGAWLVVAPFVMGYSGSTVELANDVAVGVVLIGCSWWILAAETGQVGAGALQVLAADSGSSRRRFYFHYQQLSRAFTNDVIVGILAAMVSGDGDVDALLETEPGRIRRTADLTNREQGLLDPRG